MDFLSMQQSLGKIQRKHPGNIYFLLDSNTQIAWPGHREAVKLNAGTTTSRLSYCVNGDAAVIDASLI
jgi:hypothetical protein